MNVEAEKRILKLWSVVILWANGTWRKALSILELILKRRGNNAFHQFPGSQKKFAAKRKRDVGLKLFRVFTVLVIFENFWSIRVNAKERRLREAVNLQPHAGLNLDKVGSV